MKMIEKTKYALMAMGLAFGLAAFAEPLWVVINGDDVSVGCNRAVLVFRCDKL